MDQVFADPHVQERELVRTVIHPSAGEVPVVFNPIKLSQTPAQIRRHPPELGEHTEEVLLELGFTPEQIRDWETAGIIRCSGRSPGGGA